MELIDTIMVSKLFLTVCVWDLVDFPLRPLTYLSAPSNKDSFKAWHQSHESKGVSQVWRNWNWRKDKHHTSSKSRRPRPHYTARKSEILDGRQGLEAGAWVSGDGKQ